jgi:hypothetical protein
MKISIPRIPVVVLLLFASAMTTPAQATSTWSGSVELNDGQLMIDSVNWVHAGCPQGTSYVNGNDAAFFNVKSYRGRYLKLEITGTDVQTNPTARWQDVPPKLLVSTHYQCSSEGFTVSTLNGLPLVVGSPDNELTLTRGQPLVVYVKPTMLFLGFKVLGESENYFGYRFSITLVP